MRTRTWPVLTVAFGSLIILIALSGLGAFRKGLQIYEEISSLHEDYQRRDRALAGIRTNIYLAAIYVRDYLLDPSHITAPMHREQLLAIRATMGQQLEDLRPLLSGGTEDATMLHRLEEEIDAYWNAHEPLFEWTPRQKLALSSFFLRNTVLPRREAVLDLAREVREINERNLSRQQAEVANQQQRFIQDIGRMLWISLSLGLLVALASILRISRLERRAEEALARTEKAEAELRRLSQQLVRAQEEERKSISRELHDEVGQMLTALRMELGHLDRLRNASEEEFREHIVETKRLSEQTLRSVRDLAMGLRPSMLDDIGLQPALEWQARDFSRRYGVPVTLRWDGTLPAGRLSERHRTCIFRVIQEALTNCARHAKANEIRISFHGHRDGIALTIQDDGVGFSKHESRGRGLGLIGIEERVRELGGTVTIYSQPEKGTVLSIEIPVADSKEAA
ncbi:MAG: sensor histidine kinase [Bryobacteraceae bacterium]